MFDENDITPIHDYLNDKDSEIEIEILKEINNLNKAKDIKNRYFKELKEVNYRLETL